MVVSVQQQMMSTIMRVTTTVGETSSFLKYQLVKAHALNSPHDIVVDAPRNAVG